MPPIKKMADNEEKEFFDRLAPNWDAMDDGDHGRKALIASLPIQKGMRILDAACGTGVITGELLSLSDDVVGVDISPKMLEIARKKYEGTGVVFHEVSLYEYEDEPFDGIVLYNAYPHFMERERLKKKLDELVKPGGFVAILHNMSRAKLDAHHKYVPSSISRSLLPAEEEAAFYKDAFLIERAEEDEAHYLFLLRKANRK